MAENESEASPARAPSINSVSFADLLHMEPHGPDTFVALAPRYPWGRLFGGQVVAQALRVAQLTVPDGFRCHSLHSYFIRGGTHAEPVRFEVDRIRNGRSFITRRVVARQSTGAIFNLSCSFHVGEESPDVQVVEAPADLPDPADLVNTGWGNMLDRRAVTTTHGRLTMWIRLVDSLDPSDQAINDCGLAFISDSVPTGAVRATHPHQVANREESHRVFSGASLDHSIYFHRSVDPSQWLLADVVCHSIVAARGLTVGNVFDQSGVHVATIVQEALLRERRTEGGGADGLEGNVI